jgi:hypothetical protein
MSKNKKRKVVSLKPAQLSPENYIKANARLLPIAECLLNPEWKNAGIANILVARRHKNNNITAGIYLVDTHCLGVKDAAHRFNIDASEYNDLKNAFPDWEPCEYTLAHNIIYGAIAFAEEYGFEPHKDFSIARFILEEDDERVELMELEFGLDGKPFYIYGPDDDDAKINRVVNTLKRTAGEGNFDVVDEDELEEDEAEETGLLKDMDQDELVDFFAKEKVANFKSFVRVFKRINKAYDNFVRTPEESEALKESTLGTGYKVRDGKSDDGFSMEEDREYERLNDMLMNEDDNGLLIKEALKLIEKYPGNPSFHLALQLAYNFDKQFDAADKLMEDTYQLYPWYLPVKINYATMLIDSGRLEGVLQVFDGKTDLDQIYPDRKVFDTADAAAYYACMCRYYLAIGDIDSADRYMNFIIKKEFIKKFGQLIFDTVVQEMCKAKMDKMVEVVDRSKS